MNEVVYTIGHSTHTIEDFTILLMTNKIDVVCDVRSHPFSRYNPHFNREVLDVELKRRGISYQYFGRELGARTSDVSCYRRDRVNYDILSNKSSFQDGISSVERLIRNKRVALMCAEKDPVECHRAILIAPQLIKRGISVLHILENGEVESQEKLLERLKRNLNLPENDLFLSQEETNLEAYKRQRERIAFQTTD